MKLKILWPGKTKSRELRMLQEFYLERIRFFEPCEVIETKEAKGIEEKHEQKIKDVEARNMEKHLGEDYIICLAQGGQEMTSLEFARFLEKCSASSRTVTFICGGFLGLAERILKRANTLLSLSKMTFSHELSRVILLEQIYRALTIKKGIHYAK